jgi:hypothetical protein
MSESLLSQCSVSVQRDNARPSSSIASIVGFEGYHGGFRAAGQELSKKPGGQLDRGLEQLLYLNWLHIMTILHASLNKGIISIHTDPAAQESF